MKKECYEAMVYCDEAEKKLHERHEEVASLTRNISQNVVNRFFVFDSSKRMIVNPAMDMFGLVLHAKNLYTQLCDSSVQPCILPDGVLIDNIATIKAKLQTKQKLGSLVIANMAPMPLKPDPEATWKKADIHHYFQVENCSPNKFQLVIQHCIVRDSKSSGFKTMAGMYDITESCLIKLLNDLENYAQGSQQEDAFQSVLNTIQEYNATLKEAEDLREKADVLERSVFKMAQDHFVFDAYKATITNRAVHAMGRNLFRQYNTIKSINALTMAPSTISVANLDKVRQSLRDKAQIDEVIACYTPLKMGKGFVDKHNDADDEETTDEDPPNTTYGIYMVCVVARYDAISDIDLCIRFTGQKHKTLPFEKCKQFHDICSIYAISASCLERLMDDLEAFATRHA